MSGKTLKLVIDADDAALELKDVIFNHLKDQGYDITDLNYVRENRGATYPEVGYHLAKKVQSGAYERGILICGTGLGMAMIANKVKGVYAGVCHDVFSAERLKKSNDARIITLGARVVGPELAKVIVDAYMNSEFQGGRSAPKVDKMRELENESFKQSN